MNLRVLSLTACCVLPLTGWCDDAPPPPEDVWTGKGQAGYTSSKGNADSSSANAALDAALQDGPWKHQFHVGGLYGESAGIVAAERWDTKWQSDYDLTASLYAFGGLRYERDMFSGFQYQATATVGLGYKIFATDAIKLDVQAGVGYRKLRPEELNRNPNGDNAVESRTLEPSQSGGVGTVGLNYSQALTTTTTLSDKLLVEAGSGDTLVTNALALAVKISTKLALSLGYSVQDNTSPPSGLKKLDTLETINLVYAF